MAGHDELGNKKAPGCRGLRGFLSLRGLTLRELEALAGAGTAGLLTFAHTTVACKETFFLERSAEGGVHLLDRAGETMGDGPAWPLGPPPMTRTTTSSWPSRPAVVIGRVADFTKASV